MESQRGKARKYSFEFFPPKTAEAAARLQETVRQLGQLKPDFFSCTYGAGGSTREGTLATVLQIREAGYAGAPHLSCVASTREELREVVQEYKSHGIRHIVALRGDMPSGLASAGEFRFASELVRFIRDETADWFHIEVAGYPEYHPQARKPQQDLAAFKAKIDAGADGAITQYFYNPDAYFHFVEQAEALGIDVAIVPGIMPINNFSQLARFSDACGAEIPRWMRLKLEGFGDDTASVKAFGLDVVTDLCDKLLAGGAPGLHIYTMNQAGPASTIWQ
ncbi:MAG TPA: methylenetetrahydrofolate reductase [NAD(P)H], partial [Usitatibacter sp.]|nr:methylenetetrahydrofolate reductase [NAD(P)H] [Usitatibacter sp.]